MNPSDFSKMNSTSRTLNEYVVGGRVVIRTTGIGSEGFYENHGDPRLKIFVNQLLKDNVCLKMALKCLQEQIDVLTRIILETGAEGQRM